MKISILLFLVVFFVPKTILGNVISIDGEKDAGYFYPTDQRWKIVSVKVINREDIPRDLRGIPLILMGSDIYFTKNYFTLKNINSGSESVVPSCFILKDNKLKAEPLFFSKRKYGKEITFKSTKDQKITMLYGKYFNLVLQKQLLLDNFSSKKHEFDRIYRYYTNNKRGEKVGCKLEKQGLPKLKNSDLHLIFPENGKKVTLKNHNLDPDTIMRMSYASYARRINIKSSNKYTSGNCKGEMLLYRYTTYYDNRFMFFIVGMTFGKSIIDNSPCTKTIMIKKIDYYEVLKLLGVPDDLIHQTGFKFEKWTGDNSFTATYMDYKIHFSNINKDNINVRLLEKN